MKTKGGESPIGLFEIGCGVALLAVLVGDVWSLTLELTCFAALLIGIAVFRDLFQVFRASGGERSDRSEAKPKSLWQDRRSANSASER